MAPTHSLVARKDVELLIPAVSDPPPNFSFTSALCKSNNKTIEPCNKDVLKSTIFQHKFTQAVQFPQ